MEVKKKIEVSFDLVAQRALSAYLPTSEHDVTKLHLQALREELQNYLKLVEEAETKKGSDHPTPL